MRRKLLNWCILALPLDAEALALLHQPFPIWLIASQQNFPQNYAAHDLTILGRIGCSVRGRTEYRIGRSAGLELAITGLVTARASIPYPHSRSRGPCIRKPNSTWKKDLLAIEQGTSSWERDSQRGCWDSVAGRHTCLSQHATPHEAELQADLTHA